MVQISSFCCYFNFPELIWKISMINVHFIELHTDGDKDLNWRLSADTLNFITEYLHDQNILEYAQLQRNIWPAYCIL